MLLLTPFHRSIIKRPAGYLYMVGLEDNPHKMMKEKLVDAYISVYDDVHHVTGLTKDGSIVRLIEKFATPKKT